MTTSTGLSNAAMSNGQTYMPARRVPAPHKGPPTEDMKKLRKTAEQLVAQTFYAPMLKAMRDSPFKSKMFDGGRGGEAFSGMLDEKLAERASHKAGGGLVDSIVKKFEHRMDAIAADKLRKEKIAEAEKAKHEHEHS